MNPDRSAAEASVEARCRSCDAVLSGEPTPNAPHLCASCAAEIEEEIASLKDADKAARALATAAAKHGIQCRPGSEPFDTVLEEALDRDDSDDWQAWAESEGVAALSVT